MGPLWHSKAKDTTTNTFYSNLLIQWGQILETLPINDPMNMPLWYNPRICKSILFNKNLHLNDCIYIADVCKDNGEILSCDEISSLYHCHFNFLDYHRLKTGLLAYFKHLNFCDSVTKPIQPKVIEILNKKTKGSKIFYEIMQKE